MSPPPPPPPPLPLFLLAPVPPTLPADPEVAVEAPAEPTEPAEPAEPAVPAEPVEPAEPTVAAEPIEPLPEPPPVEDPFVAAPASDSERAPTTTRAEDAARSESWVLRPGTRRSFATVSAGRMFVMGEGGDPDSEADYYDTYFSLLGPPLRLEQSLGFHFRAADGSAGFFGSLVLQEAFIGSLGPDVSVREFGIGPRVGRDVEVGGHGLYVTPTIGLGFNLLTQRQPGATTYGPYGYSPVTQEPEVTRSRRMDVQMGLAAKIVLADRLLLSFRPVDFQIVTDFSSYSLRWNLMGGMGLTF